MGKGEPAGSSGLEETTARNGSTAKDEKGKRNIASEELGTTIYCIEIFERAKGKR